MIDPKYADLPGIAYDQPDVYETNDVTENEQFQDCLPDDGDSVEKIYINATDAFNKFKDKQISYQSKTDKKELTSDETPLEKYRRLKQEIQELLDQTRTVVENTKGNEESKSMTDILHQIEITRKELEAADVDKLLSGKAIASLHNNQEIYIKELQAQIEIFKQKEEIKSKYPSKIDIPPQDLTKSGMLKYQMVYLPDKAKLQDNARISHLEKRLGQLENVVGISNDNNSKISQILKSQGVVQSIEKLMANACLLNSSQLDILENKVSSLISKMDNVIQKKASANQDTKHEKIISELYDLVKEFENYSQLLPQAIDRMLSLNGLHNKAGEFFTQLKELENLQENICRSMSNNKTALEKMQKDFSSNLDTISKDISSLNERVNKLKK